MTRACVTCVRCVCHARVEVGCAWEVRLGWDRADVHSNAWERAAGGLKCLECSSAQRRFPLTNLGARPKRVACKSGDRTGVARKRKKEEEKKRVLKLAS